MKEILGQVINDAIRDTVVAFFFKDIGIKPGPVVIKPEDQAYKPPQSDVTSIIGFSGDVEGGVHLAAPMHTAIGLASAFSGEELNDLDATGKDALCELANIIAGSVKSSLDSSIYLTPPKIVTGTNHGIEYTKKLESTKCYFSCKTGPFFVEVFYRSMTHTLIEELKEEHQNILRTFTTINQQRITTPLGKQTFWKAENLIMLHLKKEDEYMYPALRGMHKHKHSVLAMLNSVDNDMAIIAKQLVKFSTNLRSQQNPTAIEQEFIKLSATLVKRIEFEEMVVYELYESFLSDQSGQNW